MPPVERKEIDRDFSAAATHYAQHATLQARIGKALIARAEPFVAIDPLVADVGAGPGNVTLLWPGKKIALDAAFGMCCEARKKHLGAIQCDAYALPLKSASVDVVASNLMLQWLPSAAAFYAEAARVLKPGGVLAVTNFVQGTLGELHHAFEAAGEHDRMSDFIPADTMFADICHAGFNLLDEACSIWPEDYADVPALFDYLRAIGATNKQPARPRGLLTPRKLEAVTSHYPKHGKKVIASWHVQTIIARKRP